MRYPSYISKYKNKKCACNHNHVHHSRLEATHCDNLHLMMRSGHIKEIVQQKNYPLFVNGKKVCSHIPDFTLYLADGSIEVVETKGFQTDVWKLKKALFEVCYPDIKYTIWTK